MLNRRVTRLLIETFEGRGHEREEVLGPLGLAEADVLGEGPPVSWSTVARVVDRIAEIEGRDPARARALGAAMPAAPSFAPYRVVARSVVSSRAIFEVGLRFMIPATFPSLRVLSRFEGARLLLHAELPEAYAPCEAFFHIFEGNAAALPTLIGLPPAIMSESRVTGRTCDLVIELPQRASLLERARRRLGALRGVPQAMAALQEQRRQLVENARALQRERDELRALLDRLPDLVAVHRSGTILWTNRAFTSALGHDLADVVGKPLIAVVARRSRPLVRDRMRMQPEALSAVPLTEIALATRTGEEVIVEVAPTQRVVFDGAPARLIVGRDVTDRVRMQQSLIIADRLASIGLLAAGVAHEVNNPLGYVLNNIEIARRALEPDATLARSALDVALEGVDRIRVIVRDLLMLARGGGPVGVIDVCEIAESTLALAARDIERTTALTLDLGPAPSVRASAPRIGQVLLALVVNALEAMRDRPREENSLVVRIATADDGRLLLEVSDTGRGIPDADLPRLFEPFFTTKPAGQGTGLGLAIAQQLVVELGGEITVASRPGLGTTFRVLLPGVTPDEDEDARAAESPAASLRE